MLEGSKSCIYCKNTKTLGEFRVGKRKTKTGVTTYLRGDCKDCARVVKREWTRSNKDKVKQNYLVHRTKILENRRAVFEANRELRNAECREYYSTHKEQQIARANKARIEMRDSYIRALLTQNTALNAKWIPPALVEAKKLQLKIWRMSHEKC